MDPSKKQAPRRTFAEALHKKGEAANIRQVVSKAVRENAIQSRPKLVEPIDFETFVVRNKVQLHNDPQRDMLNFPHDDVELPPPAPKRYMRTVGSTVPPSAEQEATHLMVRQAIKTYNGQCHMVRFKYLSYSGSYQQLPRTAAKDPLQEHVFEIDAESEEKDDDTLTRGFVSSITKKGWLFKGPDSGKDNVISFTRQFKKRFFMLKQQSDYTYILEMFKDDKKSDAKGAIFLDLAQEVVRNTKKGKYCFEIRMTDRPPCLMAAENEAELMDWISTLNKVINSADTTSQLSRDSSKEETSSTDKPEQYKERSIDHPVVKYSRETDSSLSKARQENRQNLFAVYPDMRRTALEEDLEEEEEDEVDVFPKPVAERFLLRLEHLHTELQVMLSDAGGPKKSCNPEPFFVTFAIYDAKEHKKISEDFHVNPNEPEIQSMIPADLLNFSDKSGGDAPEMNGLKEDWLSKDPRQGIFSVVRRHSEIYVVARVEKVLQGALSQCLEPYLRGQDRKTALKVHSTIKHYCSSIGHYRMPFAWSARPLTSTAVGGSDMPLYRFDGSKFTDEEILKQLEDFKKPEKSSKLQVIPGKIRVYFDQLNADQMPENTLTPALVRVAPFTEPPSGAPTFEVEEFVPEKASLCPTFDYFINHLYVYPLSLKYDSQKTFAKARNIACCIELRDSDDDRAVPLKHIYGLPGMSVFTTAANTTVLHHSTTPNFMDEVKISLPVQIHSRHHLFFRFYHISCEASKSGSRLSAASVRKKDSIEAPVGFAWMPLLQDGRVVVGERGLPVASSLHSGYLAYDTLTPGRTSAGSPDVKWVEGGRSLFKVRLHLVSTVYTQDQHLHNFFQHCEKLEAGTSISDDMNSVNKIKSLLAVETSVYVQFLPTLLNQLFLLLTRTVSEDVAINITRVLIHIVAQIHDADKLEVLDKYVKYVFRPPEVAKGSTQRTVHEELAKQLTNILRPAQTDPQLVNSFLSHAAFFFDVLLKSMTLFLIDTERIKMPRNERFTSDCQFRLQNLLHTVTLHVTQKCRESPKEAKTANHSLANFVKACFTLMDRGYVFRLVSKYIENFVPGDIKALCDLKFEFLRIACSHEHYVPLSLPLMRRGQIKNFRDFRVEDLKHDFTLSDEFRRNHYLTGLMLHELKMAMSEPREVRRSAVTVLRNQLAKHSFDDRYATKSQQGRIAALYLPLITILLDCKLQLFRDSHATRGTNTPAPTPTQNGEATPVRTDSRSQLVPPKQAPQPQHTPETKKREKAVWEMIAGNKLLGSEGAVRRNRDSQTAFAVPQSPVEIGLATQGGEGSTNSLNSSASSDKGDKESKSKVTRTHSSAGGAGPLPSTPTATPTPSTYVSRLHKLDMTEIRDLLLCLMYVLKNLPEDILLGWFNNSSDHDVIDFFALLGLCLQTFQYQGRKKIYTLSMISGSTNQRGALSIPSFQQQRGRPISLSSQRTPSQYGDLLPDVMHTPTASDADTMLRALQEANVSTEMGLVVLDILCLYCQTFKKDLEDRGGDNHLMRTVFQLYLGYLRSPQSEQLQRHVFGAWRAFIKKFQMVLFQGSADMCGELCYEILRCCYSKLSSTRREACALLYLMMRTNFEFSNKKSFTRVHLQVIISVSELIGKVVGLSTTRFQESLAIVNNYANSDKSIQFHDHSHRKKTAFPGEVRDLTKRIRTVLMATAAMEENKNDPELLVDLQHSLAKSYASTPQLRKTWLQTMAHQHIQRENYSEAAHCYIHIAALIAEYLKRRGKLKGRSYPQGCQSFGTISPNIVAEESGIKDDSGMQDVQYTEETLVEFLELAAKYMDMGQRYEVLGDIYRIVIPIYEKLRNFQKLERCYQHLTQAYASVLDVMKSGRRLLGKYYRVAFFGQTFFEEEDGKEYIYKEPKVTSLAEILDRLRSQYTDKFGKDVIKFIKDSNKVNVADLDTKYGYIQVTFVTPYFEEKELQERVTDFERNNTIRRFMYETPFTKGTQAQGAIEEQYKRRTILVTTHTFPYIKKRVEVMSGGCREIVLTPIEVAIDEMQTKVSSLREAINSPVPDAKKLQLNLQGCVSAQVNAGPLAFAEAFLSPEKVMACGYPADKVDKLKDVFREFVSTCKDALDLNAKLIVTDQKEYHESLKAGFMEITERLATLLGEKMVPCEWLSNPRHSLTIFSNATGSSSA